MTGFNAGEPIGDLLAVLGIDFHAEPTSSYRVHLPDRTLDIVAEQDKFERAAVAAFSTSTRLSAVRHRVFWRLQATFGEALFNAASSVPRLPVRSLSDLIHDLRVLRPVGILAGTTSLVTVQDVLRALGLHRDRAFRSLISMLLEDTAQASPEVVPFANAAACLQAYRRGMSRPRGGMRALVEGIGECFAGMGGDLAHGSARRPDRADE